MSAQPTPAPNTKAPVAVKVNSNKAGVKETMSPPPSSESDRELLGSLTTLQQQRTSARVIKKLKLEPLPEPEKRDNQECETPNKTEENQLKFPTVKQRMPKALWSADEKSLFFEALNEYGKDFDAVTSHICAKMKKKGMPDVNLKTKTQVSHFYYRTWHKLSKHVHFDANVKKVAQELYALINYGELRKKLVSVNEKTCARLGEMVRCGSMVVRARGRNVRVRTPMCRALRRLNQITERGVGWRVCGAVGVVARARSGAAWRRVQAAAHNPRLHVTAPGATALATFLAALEKRWTCKHAADRAERWEEGEEPRPTCEEHDYDDRRFGEPDRMLQDEKVQNLVLHVGPSPRSEVHVPVVAAGEQLSSQKICFSSYLERLHPQGGGKEGSGAKIRTPKRQHKDSSDKDKEQVEPKKLKLELIDEMAIDGIELMANFKVSAEDEEKPSTEDEKELREEQTEDEIPMEPERDKYMSEREKDSFSEMEDEDKYKDEKSDSDNESDGKEKSGDKNKFKNLKVKFRIRPKKRGGSVYTLVTDKEPVLDPEDKFLDLKETEPKDEGKEEDIDMALKQIRKGWSVHDAGELTIGDLYLMFGSRSKLELDYWWAEPTPPLPQLHKSPPIDKLDKDRERGSLEDDKERARESDNDLFSPKNVFNDSNDGMSGDERKCEQLASPEHKSAGGSLKLTSKLINRPTPSPSHDNGFHVMTDRLKRLLALAGNVHVGGPGGGQGAGGGHGAGQGAGGGLAAACACGHVCADHREKQRIEGISLYPSPLSRVDETSPVFRQPTPIAPKSDNEGHKELCLDGIPKWRRGRPRGTNKRVVVQRLLPLLPKLTATQTPNPAPLKIVSGATPAPLKILPKPPPTSTSDLSYFYVLSESNGQFFFHDGDRRVPITPLPDNQDHTTEDEDYKDDDETDNRSDIAVVEHDVDDKVKEAEQTPAATTSEQKDTFLPSESMSPTRLLRPAEGWLEGSVQDFSLSSFLQHLDTRQQADLQVDSQLQSLMVESSVDYVAKFADLAAEVTDEVPSLNTDLT